MNEILNGINFYYVYKKNCGGRKKLRKPCERRVTSTTIFLEKVKRIKETAELINKKL